MVASKCFRNHFMSEKYKRVLHVPQNSPLKPLYTPDSDCKDIRNIPGRHFVTAFSALQSHSWWYQLHHKSAGTSKLILVEGTGKNQLKQVRRVWGCSIVVTVFFTKKFLTKTDRCAGALSWWRKETVGFPFFWTFPSDRIPKAKKDINVHFSVHSKFLQIIPANFGNF